MAVWTYDEALRRLLADEGGYSNLAADPGGPTNFGITIFDYRKYIDPSGTAADVRAMKVAQARAIYKSKYWSVQRCDELPAGVDYAVFDYGVNSGVGRSGKVLRRLVGMSSDTSSITDEVIAAARKRDPREIVTAICNERLNFLKSLKTWHIFGAGWGRRVAGVKAAALVMATKSGPSPLPPEITTTTPAPGKGKVPAPNTKVVTQAVPGAAVVAGAGFWGWLSAHPDVAFLIAAGVLAGIYVAVRAIKAAHASKQEAPPADLQALPEIHL